MITLDKKGQWFRFFETVGVRPTNLCELFWAAVFFPALWTVLGVIVSLVVIYSLLAWFHVFAQLFGVPWPFFAIRNLTSFIVFMLLLFEGAVLFVWAGTYILGGAGKAARVTGVADIAAEAYRGFKDKYCPLVEWK